VKALGAIFKPGEPHPFALV